MKENCFKGGFCARKGFTLIELLVVVLIIGILAAVALPQYTQAVEKSRFSKYRTLASALATSVEAFYLANGTWPTSFEELSINLPADMNTQNNTSYYVCRKNDQLYCCMAIPNGFTVGGNIRCGDNDYHLVYNRGYAGTDGTPKKGMVCQAKEEKYKKICKSMSDDSDPLSTHILTPSGNIAGYFSYTLN